MVKRIAALDGIRGFAVVLVILVHLFGLAQGWMGVEIFFVLSGYLITTIIRNDRKHPHFWKIFYIRRITRIVPAFLALLFLVTVLQTVHWRHLWPYLVFFGANIADVKQGDLMASAGLGALWSLAVEEHFYLSGPQKSDCSRQETYR
jgi:peptidoglycan/LPS O-acetylase OafA/YrhL